MNGGPDVKRLVEEQVDPQISGKSPFVVLQHVLDAVHDVNGRGAAGFVNAHEHATLAVGENDICLRREAVADVRHVLHVDGGAVDGFDRQVVEFLNGLRAPVHLDVVFERAELGRACGKNQVLRIHRADDVHGREAFGLQRGGVNVHADDALLSAVRKRRGSARDGGKLRADKIVAEIEELLLAHGVAGEPNLNDGHRRGGIDDHQGRRRSRRQEPQEGLRDGSGLRQSGLDVRVGLKKDLDDGNAV